MNDAISGWNDWADVMTSCENEWEEMNICELQGLITAVVAICEAPTEKEWQLLFENAFIPLPPERLLQLIIEEGDDVHDQFKDKEDAYEYHPLLPDESHDIIERLTGIASWANGFLTGYGITCVTPRKDEEELLLSLQKLARLDINAEEIALAEEEDEGSTEADYIELVEFARMVPVSMSSMGDFKKVTKLPIIAGLPMQTKTDKPQTNGAETSRIEAEIFKPF